MTTAAPRSAAAARAFWWACALVAPPLALAVAAAGYPMPARDPARDLAVIALWSVAEEIVFRGALQPTLARAFAGRVTTPTEAAWLTPANLATSVVFAALHLWRHPWPVALGVSRSRSSTAKRAS